MIDPNMKSLHFRGADCSGNHGAINRHLNLDAIVLVTLDNVKVNGHDIETELDEKGIIFLGKVLHSDLISIFYKPHKQEEGGMREIKYRAFLKKEKLMLEVKSIDFETRKVTLLSVAVDVSPRLKLPKGAIGRCMHDQVQKFDDIILMEFIGNKDKFSMDIYEGDKLTHCDRTIIIEDIRDIDSDLMSMSDVDWEIIGNIYTDKEKMKDAST